MPLLVECGVVWAPPSSREEHWHRQPKHWQAQDTSKESVRSVTWLRTKNPRGTIFKIRKIIH